MNSPQSTYPTAWGVELVRNAQGRAWYFVSRFVSRYRVEYLSDAAGEAIAYRYKPTAEKAATRGTP
jgi:hypothetical protein